MSQEALSSTVQQLQSQVQTITTELNTIVLTFTERIDSEIKRTQGIVDTVNARVSVIDGKLEVELNPLITLSAPSNIQQLMDFTQKTSSANYDSKLQALSDATDELKAKMEKFNTTVDAIAAATGRLGTVDTKVNAAVGELAKVKGDIALNE